MTTARKDDPNPGDSAAAVARKALQRLKRSKADTPLAYKAANALVDSGVTLPDGALPVLIDVLTAFEQGQKVRVLNEEEVLTTTQAAKELGVSRPFLVSHMLAPDVIPFHMVGSHKRVYRSDLEAYKAERSRREKVLTELARESQKLGLGYDY